MRIPETKITPLVQTVFKALENGSDAERVDDFLKVAEIELGRITDAGGGDPVNSDIVAAANQVVEALRKAAPDGITAEEQRDVAQPTNRLRELAPDPLEAGVTDRAKVAADELIQKLGNESPAAKQVFDELRATGGLPEFDFQNLPEGRNGMYDPRSKKLVIDADYVLRNPDIAAVTIAHEYFHALDDRTGATKAAREAVPQMPIVAETRAYTFGAEVSRDLGLSPGDFENPKARAALEAGSAEAAYQKIWDMHRDGSGKEGEVPAKAVVLDEFGMY